MENEIWKNITDYENYQISNLGRVKNTKTNYFLKYHLDIQGYQNISIRKNNKTKTLKIHRLIAIYFIPNPENKQTINHKNNIRDDNRIDNLEWSTMSEQNLAINKSIGAFLNKSDRRCVLRINLSDKTTILEKYYSIKDASKWIFDNKLSSVSEFNKNTSSIISSKICAVANSKRINAYGFFWKYNKDEDIENEIWKEIPLNLTNNRCGYYVSSLGRFKNNKDQIINVKNSTGYKRINICDVKYLLHRLVAITFIQNPDNKEQVNHIDGNKLNNNVDNLEWVTNQENQIHKVKIGLYKGTRKIIQYDKYMNIINKFNSIIEATRILNINKNTIIRSCKGKTSTPNCGFQFRYDIV
jgi:hypothetical protein